MNIYETAQINIRKWIQHIIMTSFCFFLHLGALSWVSEKDYGFLFWPGTHWTTWGIYDTVQYALTGTYAIAFDVSVANLNHFGLINNPLPVEEAILAENRVVTDLPTAQVSYSVIIDGVESATTGFLSSTGQAKNPSRIIDMGRFMQRVDIPQVTYADGALSGSIQGSNSIDILVKSPKPVPKHV